MRWLAFLFLVSGCGIISGLDPLHVDDSGTSEDAPTDVLQSDGTVDAPNDATGGNDGASDAPDSADAPHDATPKGDTGGGLDAFAGCSAGGLCGPSQYCQLPIGVCSGDGTCTAIPGPCSLISNPVCGCDKKNYNNPCDANRAGINIAYMGYCE